MKLHTLSLSALLLSISSLSHAQVVEPTLEVVQNETATQSAFDADAEGDGRDLSAAESRSLAPLLIGDPPIAHPCTAIPAGFGSGNVPRQFQARACSRVAARTLALGRCEGGFGNRNCKVRCDRVAPGGRSNDRDLHEPGFVLTPATLAADDVGHLSSGLGPIYPPDFRAPPRASSSVFRRLLQREIGPAPVHLAPKPAEISRKNPPPKSERTARHPERNRAKP